MTFKKDVVELLRKLSAELEKEPASEQERAFQRTIIRYLRGILGAIDDLVKSMKL